jgi:hypothetical protein
VSLAKFEAEAADVGARAGSGACSGTEGNQRRRCQGVSAPSPVISVFAVSPAHRSPALIPVNVDVGGLVSERSSAPSSGVDVVGGRCLIDVGAVQLPLAPLAGRATVVAAERRGKGVGRRVAGARGDLRERQLASA